jgi:hypothetical protein
VYDIDHELSTLEKEQKEETINSDEDIDSNYENKQKDQSGNIILSLEVP